MIPMGTTLKKRNCQPRAVPEKPGQAGAERQAAVHADGSKPEHPAELFRRRAAHQDRQRAGIHDGGAHRLYETAAQEQPDVRHERQQGRHDDEQRQAAEEKPLAPDHVPHPARHQMENRQRQRVGRVDEAQLHGAGVQIPPDGGQQRPRAGQHERQHELGGPHGDNDGAQGDDGTFHIAGSIRMFSSHENLVRPLCRGGQSSKLNA